MKKDYQNIKRLIERNEYFYQKKSITNIEYAGNNLLFVDMLDKILNEDQRKIVRDFLFDEFSLPKFRLSIQILKAASN